MSDDNNAGGLFTSLALSLVCVYITLNAQQMWAWASALQVWEIPAKIFLAFAFIEGALFLIVIAGVIIMLIFKLAVAAAKVVT